MTDLELAEEIERQLRNDASLDPSIMLGEEKWCVIIAALRRGPEPVPEGFVRTIPDPLGRTICTAEAMGLLTERPPSGEMVHGTYECPICGKDYPHSVLTHAIDASEKESRWRERFERFFPEAQQALRGNLVNNDYERGISLTANQIRNWRLREGDGYWSPLATVMWQAWKAALSAAEAEVRKP